MNYILNSENINQLWANLIVEELVRNDINYFCISPGSRSTPLTVAAGRHPGAKTIIIFDERGAAFHALGYARATLKPAVLICTSGTAAANYYPAVIEASLENLPMIILSADRPPELRETGANQTINQINLFGGYTRWFFDLPCPNEYIQAGFVLSNTDYALQKACTINPGPVHINCMFREPLAPEKIPFDANYLSGFNEWLSSEKPFTTLISSLLSPDKLSVDQVVAVFKNNSSGIILAGREQNIDESRHILELAQKTGWPVFPDVTSGLRLQDDPQIIHHFDQILLSEEFQQRLIAQPILHFGGQFVSKRLLQFLSTHKGPYVHVSPFEKRIDPGSKITLRVQADVKAFIKNLFSQMSPATDSPLLDELKNLNRKVSSHITSSLNTDSGISEIAAAQIISQNMTENSCLFLASSMPVRDFDMFAAAGKNNIRVGANRGASGIDGTIASALGFAAGLKQPLTLVIGDLAFIHDMNSLVMLKDFNFPVTIVLINNQGGGIFSFLPIASHSDVFEKYFGTPHSFTFSKTAEMFKLDYFEPSTISDFRSVYKNASQNKKHTLIEIRTERNTNQRLHSVLQKQIRDLLS